MRASVVPFGSMCGQVDQMKRICNMAEEQEEELKEKKRRRRKKRSAKAEEATPPRPSRRIR
jgi:sRNA-binding protein